MTMRPHGKLALQDGTTDGRRHTNAEPMTIGKTPTNYQQRVGTAARDTLGKRWVRWANPSIRPEGDVDERQHCLLPGVSRETHVESLRIAAQIGSDAGSPTKRNAHFVPEPQLFGSTRV